MVVLELLRASFWRQRSLYFLWLFSLALAVTGLVTVDVFRSSLSETLRTQGRKILTADVSITTRRKLSEAEKLDFRSFFAKAARFSELTEMFGMITAGRESRLAMLRFVSDEYPLVGDLDVAHSGRPEAWVAEDVLTLFNTQVGSNLKIGVLEFKIAGVVKKDSSQTFRFGNMAPRVYLPLGFLDGTQLVQFGSTYSNSYFAASDQPLDPGLKKMISARFKDPGVQVTVPKDLEQGSLRVLSRLLDFLGLTGLITLALGWVGVYYLGRRWLALESESAAILKALGYSSGQLNRLLQIKLILVLLGGVILGAGLAWIGAVLLLPLVRESMPADFTLIWSWMNTLLILVVGPLAGFIFLWQPIRQLAFSKSVFQMGEQTVRRPNIKSVVTVLVCTAALMLLLTFLQARSWAVTGAFLGAIGASILLIAGLGYGALHFVTARRRPRWGVTVHLTTALWSRRMGTSLLLIMVSAIAGLLSQLLPHLEKTLVGELRAPTQEERPGLFMVDIQDEQLDPLKKFLRDNGVGVSKSSPFVRARILSVNGVDFERSEVSDWSTREEESDARFRNRGVNLSYRTELSKSEQVISGKKWSELQIEPPEISVEKGYADRLGLKLGDRVRFDVQGVEIETTIGNLRSVNWDSFEPNFFVQFPDGVLNQAPKTWVMTVKRSPMDTPVRIQSLVTAKFPNITSINVQAALDIVSAFIAKLSSGLKLPSALALALGIGVFLLILLFQLLSGRRDWGQLLVLGMTTRQVLMIQILTYGGLCLLGTLLGALLSMAVAWALFHFAFGSDVQFDFLAMLRIWLLTWSVAFCGLSILGWRELKRARKTFV